MPEPDSLFPPLDKEVSLIRDAAYEAGKIARDAFNDGASKVWDKTEDHPVTDADIAVNDYLTQTLQKARPGYGWLSEETQDDLSRHSATRTFVVDPIDGTRAFIDRTHNFTVSIAVVENGASIAAALYNPMRDEMFTAVKGGGAKLNGRPISTSNVNKIDGCRMVGYPRKFRRLGFPDMNVRVVNSMAYRIALVAAGMSDATIAFTPKSDWDLAAAELIAQEAGAIVTDILGRQFRYDHDSVRELGVICAGPELHSLLLEHIAPRAAKVAAGKITKQDIEDMGTRMSDRKETDIQLLHLVIGGELVDPNKTEFKNLKEVDFVGAFGCYADARDAWKSAAQRTVDNAHMRYFVLHAHELIDPDKDGIIG